MGDIPTAQPVRPMVAAAGQPIAAPAGGGCRRSRLGVVGIIAIPFLRDRVVVGVSTGPEPSPVDIAPIPQIVPALIAWSGPIGHLVP